MPESSLLRTIRPVVCIGYGASGVRWLRRIAIGAHQAPFLANLVKHGLVQFWSVGEAGGDVDGLWSLSADEHPDALLERLNRSRRNELRFNVQGLELQQVMVLERVSLYDESCEQRNSLRERLESARQQADDDSSSASKSTSKAFVYDWLALIDGAWSDGRPGSERQQLASRIIRGLRARRSFYVDQQSAEHGVVPADEADQVLAQLALAFLSSDLGFPRAEAGDEGRSRAVDRPAMEGTATPVGLITLVHRREQFARQRARMLLRQILRGPTDDAPDVVETSLAASTTLAAALTEELKDIDGGASGLKANTRRRLAIRAVVARCLVDRSPTDGQLALERLRGVIAARRQAAGFTFQAAAASAMVVLDVPSSAALAGILVAAMLTAVAAMVFRRGSASKPDETVVRPVNEDIELSTARTLKEWERMADALDALFADYRQHLAKWDNGGMETAEPWERGDLPYQWRLGDSPIDIERTKAGSWLYEELSNIVAERVSRVNGSDISLETSLSAVADREFTEGTRTVDELLRPLFEAPHNRVVRDAVRAMSPLANIVGGPRIQEVTWLVSGAVTCEDLLTKMERAPHQNFTRVLASEDSGQSTRVVFGEDVQWRSIASLSYLAPNSGTAS